MFKTTALVSSLLLGLTSSFGQMVTKIDSFSPSGQIPIANQVHVQFSEFMFALGATAEDPMASECLKNGKGRWLNPKEWVFDFAAPLPPHTECSFELIKGLKSLKGFPVMSSAPFRFKITPAMLAETRPNAESWESVQRRQWGETDPDQVFLFNFDQEIQKKEIEDRFYFTVEGQHDEIKVKVLDSAVLKKLKSEGHLWMNQTPHHPWFVVKPVLDFPNTPAMVITLHDRLENSDKYFLTRKSFSADFTCTRENAGAPCSPFSQAELYFNAPVARGDLLKIKVIGPNGVQKPIELSKSDETVQSHEDRIFIKPPFAGKATYKIVIPTGLKDMHGRSLVNASSFPLSFDTDGLPAIAKFPGRFGILEAENAQLPITVRNIEKTIAIKSADLIQYRSPEHAPAILNWIKRVEEQEYHYSSEAHVRANGKANDYQSVLESYPDETKGKTARTKLPTADLKNDAEVVGIPMQKKGFFVVEAESTILGKRLMDRETPLYTSTAVLVTNLGVHFKWGQGGPSLAWVTDLSSGKPISGADITVEACDGKVLGKGVTDHDGTLSLTVWSRQELANQHHSCEWEYSGGVSLMVLAHKDDDFSFTTDEWRRGIEPWRFRIKPGSSDPISAHTVLARDYLKPGQTVDLKHYYREFHWQGFTVPKRLPSFAVIRHLGSDESWSIPVKFNAQGIATSKWKVPETANLGHYTITLSSVSGGEQKPSKKRRSRAHPKPVASEDQINVMTGGFDVEEFRMPVMNVSMKLPDAISPNQAKDAQSKIALQGTYISGGVTSGLPVSLRFQRKAEAKHAQVFGDFIYAQDEPVKTGLSEKAEENYDTESEGEGDGESPVVSNAKKNDQNVLASKLELKRNLDAGGSAYLEFPKEVLDTNQDGQIYVALQYSDPNGEVQTAVRIAKVHSRDRYLGIQKDIKTYMDDIKSVPFDFSMIGIDQKPVANVQVDVAIYRSTDFVHRTRLVGGFYGYHTVTEIKKVSEVCSGKTQDSGKLHCEVTLPESGRYLIEARAKDSQGRPISFTHTFYAWGKDAEAGDYSESDRLTLVPNKEDYQTGESAEIVVESPFKNFTALVTLERDGVMEHRVESLSGTKPVIHLPLKSEYSPNVVVSVFAVRGRTAEPAATGLVDLAKPAFKMGMISLSTGKKAHELPIEIKTNKKLFQVREEVSVSIQTKPGAEMALAVVDQALLHLKPNATWDLLSAMLTDRGHNVETSTMQMNLIGKRHFGKKATPFGGGGGKMITRELLDSLVSWQPNLKADSNGLISTKFKLNDSISSFAVVAVGSEGLNLYGHAQTEVSANQDLQVISSVPPTLREHDQLPLQFVLRNTTAKSLHVKASLNSESTLAVEVPAQSSKEIKFDYTVPMGIQKLEFTMTAISDEGARDELKVTSKVVEAVPTTVREGFLEQLTSSQALLPITFPKDAIQEKGGYRIQLQSNLSDVPLSLLRYLQGYEYGCFEQKTSKAIGLEDLKAWKELWLKAKTYLDSNSLIKFFPEMRYGSVDLTAYVLTIADEASLINPKFKLGGATDSAEQKALVQRLLEALRRAMRGEIRITQEWWPTYVSRHQRLAATEALSRYEPINPADYEAVKSGYDSKSVVQLLALSQILRHSPKSLAQSMGDLSIYRQQILALFDFENTHLRLRDPSYSFFAPLSGSPDAQKARALIAWIADDQKDNATKMLRTMQEDLKTGYFDTTPSDAWASVALKEFKGKYEKTKVKGTASFAIGDLHQSANLTEKTAKAEVFLPIKKVSAGSKELKQFFAGTGAPWSFTLVEAAVPITSALDHGYVITKSIEPVQKANREKNTRGDLYKVKLTIEARSPQTWIVLKDPIPTGASILATESDSQGSRFIAFEERRTDRMQVFYEYLPKGKSDFTYTVRLNQVGQFDFPPTRIEAMYDPTQYGELPNASMKVVPSE